MSLIASTPEPPYYAVIFTSQRSTGDDEAYRNMAEKMVELASGQPGFLGLESIRDDRDGIGITVSYWADLESIKNWKSNLEHREARKLGRERWYLDFRARISKVERDYGL